MTRVVAMYMPKGGVGKSFLTGHLASGLAIAGKRVIAIDADPGQGQLALRMGGLQRRGDLLRLFREGASDALLQRHPHFDSLSVVTADPVDVDKFAEITTRGPYWPWILRDERLGTWLKGDWDYIIFDCGPGFESPVTACVLQAATEMWLPYAVDYESLDSYNNLIGQLLPKARRDPQQFITAVIPNKLVLGRQRVDVASDLSTFTEAERKRAELISKARTNDALIILEMLKDMFKGKMLTPVRMAEALSQKTAGDGELLWQMAPGSDVVEDLSYVVEALIEQEEIVHGRAV